MIYIATRTLVQNVNRIKDVLNNIRSAIIAKGVTPTGDCSTYASAITAISTASKYIPVVIQKVLSNTYGLVCRYYEGYSGYITYGAGSYVAQLNSSDLTELIGKTVTNTLSFYRRAITFNQAGTYKISSTVGYNTSSYSDTAQLMSFISRDYASNKASLLSAYANKVSDITGVSQSTYQAYSAMELSNSDDIVVNAGDVLYEYYAMYSSSTVGIREIMIKEI